ncbi:MAG: competence/damage-inducible protein A [Bryobacterales bacterium]|nr:competence/damage-inducible protein A [Bryobacteraceae bacterium]MDW8353857.1 competence/damage-inducible protein A [Bryobacterales bacterium]
MNAEIIAVGSELLTPQRLDTNSLFLTEHLNNLGIEVVCKMVVGDDRSRLAEAVRGALARSEIILLTGGLGPTEDDVTREAVAAALGRSLVFRADLLEWIEERFRRAGRRMAEINRRQAYIIEGAEAWRNDNGTAPGLWVEHDGRVVILLPGPPAELQPMFLRECLPKLERWAPRQVIRTRVYRVAGMPESDLDQLIAPVYRKYANPITTILAAPGDIQIHLRARCATAEEAERLLDELGGQIEVLLGDKIYSRNGESLEVVVGARLRAAGATLSVAESCTAGLLAARITEVPGSSDYFLGGFLVYSADLKVRLLGVPRALLDEHGVVSEPVAQAMAAGARERTQSTYALAVTGVAGPSGGTDAAPVGTVCIGLADSTGADARRFRFPGDRARVRTVAVQTALDWLRRRLG